MTASRRSWTDVTTNTVFLAGTDVERDLPGLLSFGEAPVRLAASFLHEATHHWCYDSPVGYALAMLQLRIHRLALAISAHPSSSASLELAGAANRYQAALAMLKPLDEGMALFAEFDATTREHSRTLSSPLKLAALFFRVPPSVQKEDFGDRDLLPATAWCQGFIQKLRLSPRLLERKAGILCGPLTVSGNCYLAGYLLVRQLWIAATQRDWRLASETDLFLSYLRTFLYDDLGLADLLLSDELDEIQGATAVATRISQRLGAFVELTAQDVTDFEEIITSPGDQPLGYTGRAIQVSELECDRGRLALTTAGAASETRSGDENDDALRFHEQCVLIRRQLLYLGSWAVETEVSAGRYRVLKNGVTLREGPALPGKGEGSAAGYIDVVYWISRGERVCAVRRGREVVAVESALNSAQRGDLEGDPEFVLLLEQRYAAGDLLTQLDELVEDVIADSWIEIAVDHIRSQLDTVVAQAYLPSALGDVPQDEVSAVAARMRETGFYGLLGRDRCLVEGLAALGICCSTLAPYENWAQSFLRSRGLDYGHTIDAVDRLFAEIGVARVYRFAGALLPSV